MTEILEMWPYAVVAAICILVTWAGTAFYYYRKYTALIMVTLDRQFENFDKRLQEYK